MYQFPECDSDEDEEFKQLDKELKVSLFNCTLNHTCCLLINLCMNAWKEEYTLSGSTLNSHAPLELLYVSVFTSMLSPCLLGREGLKKAVCVSVCRSAPRSL